MSKLGLPVTQNDDERRCHYYFECKNGKDVLSWYQAKDDETCEACCVHIQRIADQTDISRDHFPGAFYHKIKSIILVMGK